MKFGLQGTILSAIMALNLSPLAHVFTEGMLSKKFQITKGICQGCPLSPLMFTLLMGTVAQKIRHCNAILGIPVCDKEHKIILFSDVIILSLCDLASSLSEVHTILKVFDMVLCYKINKAKSNILGVGLDKHTKSHVQQLFPFHWVSSFMPYLRISLTSTTSDHFKKERR